MRRLQKILGGIFLTGVLVGGVGTGIAMVEYSSLAYGGEKVIGQDSLVTRTLDFNFDLDGRILEVAGVHYRGRGEIQEIEIDNSVPAGTVRFEVTYNEKTVTPNLEFEAYEPEEDYQDEEEADYVDEGEWEEAAESEAEPGVEPEARAKTEPDSDAESAAESADQGEELLQAEEGAGGLEESIPETKEKKPEKLGYLRLVYTYHDNNFAILMENKDCVLQELKQGKISSYDVAYITNIKIKVNQETAPYIDSYYVIR